MVLFNYATKELTAKVVYYGPGLCGKTTNLQYIYDTLPGNAKGKMLSLATKTDRTLFFDFLPIDLGKIRGMKTKIQLYTVPGQVFYDTTRKLVLKGADGVVFVADSQAPMVEANMDSFQNLITNLKEQNIDIKDMPHVMQFNKRDMKNAMPVEELDARINIYNVPFFEAVALRGDGVFETLKGISKQVLKNLAAKYGLEEEKAEILDQKESVSKPRKPVPKIPDLPPRPKPAAARPQQKTPPAAKQPPPEPVQPPVAAKPMPDLPAFQPPVAPTPPVVVAPPVEQTPPVAAAPVVKTTPPAATPANHFDLQKTAMDVETSLDEIEFIEDEKEEAVAAHNYDSPTRELPEETPLTIPDEPTEEPFADLAAEAAANGGRLGALEPIPSLDDSEVIELDDIEPLEIEEMDEMAEIAKMASEVPGGNLQPIDVPIEVNLPVSLSGKPLRLQIDIKFE